MCDLRCSRVDDDLLQHQLELELFSFIHNCFSKCITKQVMESRKHRSKNVARDLLHVIYLSKVAIDAFYITEELRMLDSMRRFYEDSNGSSKADT